MGSIVAELAEKLTSATNSFDIDEQTLYVNTSADTVGIGTNSPDGKLSVHQTGTGDILNLYDGTTAVFTVLDGGNVGIGTTAPDELLHLVSSTSLKPVLKIENKNDDQHNPQIHLVKNPATGGAEADDDYLGQIDFKGLNDVDASPITFGRLQGVAKDVSDGTEDGRVYIAAMNAGTLDQTFNVVSGKVGIGITTPTEKLQVNGNIKADHLIINDAGTIGSTTTTNAITIAANGTLTLSTAPAGFNYVATVAAAQTGSTDGIVITGSGTAAAGVTVAHADTSSQATVNNSGSTFIQDITLDTYGHIIGISSATSTDTNTTYSAGDGLALSGTTFSVDSLSHLNSVTIGRLTIDGAAGSSATSKIESGSYSSGTADLRFHTMEPYTNSGNMWEKLRITGSGKIVGRSKYNTASMTVTTSSSRPGFEFGNTNSSMGGICAVSFSNTSSSQNHFFFGNTNGNTGSINTSGSGCTFNSLSDYRKKENVIPISDAEDRLNKLKPSRFNFISDKSVTLDGFLAHEVSDVVPEAVIGEKDAVDEDGEMVTQQMDNSRLVPLLVATVQELSAKVKALESA